MADIVVVDSVNTQEMETRAKGLKHVEDHT